MNRGNSDRYPDRTASDFADESPAYKCSCGFYRTEYPHIVSLCPACGAPIDIDE